VQSLQLFLISVQHLVHTPLVLELQKLELSISRILRSHFQHIQLSFSSLSSDFPYIHCDSNIKWATNHYHQHSSIHIINHRRRHYTKCLSVLSNFCNSETNKLQCGPPNSYIITVHHFASSQKTNTWYWGHKKLSAGKVIWFGTEGNCSSQEWWHNLSLNEYFRIIAITKTYARLDTGS
jgi:hypothetical protein